MADTTTPPTDGRDDQPGSDPAPDGEGDGSTGGGTEGGNGGDDDLSVPGVPTDPTHPTG